MGLFDWFKQKPEAGHGGPAPAPAVTISDREARDAKMVDEGLEHLRKGEVPFAATLFGGVVTRAPEDYVDEFEADGRLFVKAWDLQDFLLRATSDRASSDGLERVQIPNAYPRACYYLGYIQLDRGDLTGAVRTFELGLRLVPDNAKLAIEFAQALVGLRRYDEALDLVNGVLDRRDSATNGDRAVALRCKGFVLIERGELDAAEAAYRESQQLDPNSTLASRQLAYVDSLRARQTQ